MALTREDLIREAEDQLEHLREYRDSINRDIERAKQTLNILRGEAPTTIHLSNPDSGYTPDKITRLLTEIVGRRENVSTVIITNKWTPRDGSHD